MKTLGQLIEGAGAGSEDFAYSGGDSSSSSNSSSSSSSNKKNQRAVAHDANPNPALGDEEGGLGLEVEVKNIESIAREMALESLMQVRVGVLGEGWGWGWGWGRGWGRGWV